MYRCLNFFWMMSVVVKKKEIGILKYVLKSSFCTGKVGYCGFYFFRVESQFEQDEDNSSCIEYISVSIKRNVKGPEINSFLS